MAFVLSVATKTLAGGDDPDDESDSKEFAAAFTFLPPFLVRFSAFRLDKQVAAFLIRAGVLSPVSPLRKVGGIPAPAFLLSWTVWQSGG